MAAFTPQEWSRSRRPSEFLYDVETRVIRIRKLLISISVDELNRQSGVRDKALSLCDQIQRMCERGRRESASVAAEYAELVEILVDVLCAMKLSRRGQTTE